VQAGALTFLFTDIEASTRQWEADATGMSAALARHDETLRAAIVAAGGTVFKHTGDGICAVFPSAGAGLAGALNAQRQLAGIPLRVRMAVHSGDVEQRGGDYFGPTLNRVARLMAAAWGRQTLVSAAAAELAGDDLPAGATLVDLGVHRLADLSRPERIFQLTGVGLETAFPPVRAVSTRRHNLPQSLTSFVGRDRELAEIAELLKTCRLVTLAGVGGAGKTRLATEAAARALDGFPDGAFLVELAPITDTALVPATVAAALGLLLDRPGPLADQLAGYLERRTTLIVLDNCEHVVDATAGLAETVLRQAPGVAILATSREPLGVPGETVWRIPPLAVADAMDLVCDRARAAHPDFAPSDADTEALERICARLDGMPLALELAAARLHLLSPTEVASRLDDRFRLLTGGARTAVDRHRTLRATIDWGYDLLDEPSRSLLRRLSVFVGGFDLAAAEAVAGAEALDLLGGLVDRSWVAVDPPGHGPTRYRLIETIRQYAAEKLAEAGEAEGARRAHCAHFRRLAEDRADVTGLGPAWLRCVRLEEDNLRAALGWCADQRDRDSCLELAAAVLGYLAFTARSGEGRDWLERALAIEPRDTSWRTLIAMWLLVAYWPDFEAGAGDSWLQELLASVDRVGDGALAANLRSTLALQLVRQDPSRAAELLAADRDPEASPVSTTWAKINRGWVWLAVPDQEAAGRSFSQGLELARQSNHAVAVVHAAAALAAVTAARGEAEPAVALAEEAIASARALDLPIVLVMALTRGAEVQVLLGTPTGAAPSLAEALRILRDVGTRGWVAEALELAAVLAAEGGGDADAVRLLAAASSVDAATGDRHRPLADLVTNRLRQALGDDRFAAGWAAGAALRVDDALTLALTIALASGKGSGPA
jgi:predicted ATPase/class 3 adenylate cyclase